jgi:hypothetical protein
MLCQQVEPIRGSHLVLDVSVKASICIDLYRQIPSTREATQRFGLVQRILNGRAAQRLPLLHEVDSQHRRTEYRWAATTT